MPVVAGHQASVQCTVKKTHENSLAAVDLFCGAGGLTKGLQLAGIDVKLGIDIDPACAFPFEANTEAKFLLKRIEKVTPAEIKRAFGSAPLRLLAGCAPCQPFNPPSRPSTTAAAFFFVFAMAPVSHTAAVC
jgi:DNA (cytosine-5)-methyltransferase 1